MRRRRVSTRGWGEEEDVGGARRIDLRGWTICGDNLLTYMGSFFFAGGEGVGRQDAGGEGTFLGSGEGGVGK